MAKPAGPPATALYWRVFKVPLGEGVIKGVLKELIREAEKIQKVIKMLQHPILTISPADGRLLISSWNSLCLTLVIFLSQKIAYKSRSRVNFNP